MSFWRNLLCELSFHRWEYTNRREQKYTTTELRTCSNCSQEEECIYSNFTDDGTLVTKKGSLPKK